MIFCFKLVFLTILMVLVSYGQADGVFDVTKFGADSSGVNKSSEAIKLAIDAAHSKGGGTVYFPKGQYLTGAIHLLSDITLELADNVVIKFSTDFNDYLPMVRMRWEGTEVINFSPLIYAFKQQNIIIKGKGILEGQGSVWWKEWVKLEATYNKNGTRDTKYQTEFIHLNNLTEIHTETDDMSRLNVAFLRPPFIQPFGSKNILIQDVTVRNSPFWNLNPVYCENVTIRDVIIDSPYNSPNTDGIDPDSCKDVLITNVEFNVGDDCIVLKSGRDGQGRRIHKPTENVVISNCKMFRGVSGVAIGSEMSGGVRNVTVKDCVFNGTDRGLYIKTPRGRGGVVENIHYNNITVIGAQKEKRGEGILIITSSTDDPKHWEPFTNRTPVIRNIYFNDIRGDALYSARIIGLHESLLENIEIKNFNITSKYGTFIQNAKSLSLFGFQEKTLNNL